MALPGTMGRRLLLGVLFGALVYALLAVWADIGAVRATLATFPLFLLPVAMLLSFLNYTVRFARWEHYRKLLDIELDRRTSFLIYLAGLALTVTPGKMGETFKSWLLRRVTGTRVHKSAPIVVAERVTDLLGFLVLIAIGGIATQPEYAWIFWAASGLCAALVALISSRHATSVVLAMLARLPGLRRLVPKAAVSIESARVLLAPRQLFGPTLIATIGWSLECTAFWLIARALAPGAIPFLFAVYTFALSAVAGAVLILFPGGLGVTEASMGALLRRRYVLAGISADAASAKAISATLLIRLCTLWFAVGVGLVATFLFTRRFGDVQDESKAAEAARAD